MTRGDGDVTGGHEPWPNAAQRRAAAGAVPPELPTGPLPARPRIEDDPGLLGITRRSNSRIGSRLFTMFFVFVFVLILLQMVVALLDG